MIHITDRTREDVMLGTAKGHYNISDLNRVEKNTKELYTRARRFGLRLPGLVFKTDWHLTNTFSPGEWVTESQMRRYLDNIIALAAVLDRQGLISLPQSMAKLDYSGANDIERSLQLIEELLDAIQKSWLYCGAAECGGY